MKKVLAILNTPRFSGGEKVVLNLFLNNKNIESTIVVDKNFDKDFPGLNIVRTSFIRSLNRNKSSVLSYIQYFPSLLLLNFLVAKLLFKNRYDVVHVNNMPLCIYLSPVVFVSRKIFRIKSKFLFHDHNLQTIETSFIDKVQQNTSKTYDIILGVSQKFNLKYEFLKNKINILYNGIDTEKYKYDLVQRNKIRESLRLENKVIVGIFGSINEYKGHQSLIEICQILFKDYSDLHLVILGKIGTHNEKFLHSIKSITKLYSSNITVIDELDNIVGHYSAIDILVNNTTAKVEEPLGTTILEAMACSKIVVAANTGGTAEIISDNFNGIMFEADNSKDLEDKLRYSITNLHTLSEIRQNARNTILEKFRIELMVNNYNKILSNNIDMKTDER